jgi:hypothetical protein
MRVNKASVLIMETVIKLGKHTLFWRRP